MHLTTFYLKSGEIACDYIKKVDLKNRKVLLWDKKIWIRFSALKSAVTENERVSVSKSNIDFDELPRWLELSRQHRNSANERG